jgi:uncharacterized protein (DUF2461 family)
MVSIKTSMPLHQGGRMPFDGFPEQSLPFLAALRENNTKACFEAHRDQYDKLILAPSRAFVEEN